MEEEEVKLLDLEGEVILLVVQRMDSSQAQLMDLLSYLQHLLIMHQVLLSLR